MNEIKRIELQNVLAIRHKVMWPNKPLAYVKLPKDKEGRHFGFFIREELIGVISVFVEENGVQFRKFAILQKFQGKGFGSQLLTYIIEFVRNENHKKIWCNARVDKISFYHKFGLKETNRCFTKGDINYVIMEKVF